MRVSSWIAFPVYAISTSALVIPNTGPSNDAVAGSIAHPNTTDAVDQPIKTLQTEYEKLELLKHQVFALHHEVLKQEHEIFILINRDFKSCSGVRCYLQTALRKAPDFFELLKTHFRHHPKNATASEWDCLWMGKNSKAQELPLSEVDAVDGAPPSTEVQPLHLGDDLKASQPPPSNVFDDIADHDSNTNLPPPPSDTEDGPFDFSPPGDDRPRPSWHPGQHGPPPAHDPEYNPWKENPNAPAPHPDHDRSPHPFHMPHPAPRHRHFKLILATAGFVVTVFILAILFKALRLYFNNPRRRADRAARREECRTRREYRRAACQHRFRQIISGLCPGRRRGESSTEDDEEKRAILGQGSNFDAADHIMGADINSLRRAHDIVGRIMRAKEERMHTYPPFQQPQQQEEPVASSSRSVRSFQTTTTLPAYAPPPPRYSQELARDMEVVDGFHYTPSQSDATVVSSASSFILDDGDLCTESSVVDCRSRLSMDTESITPSQTRETSRNRKSLELAGDRFRGQFN